MTTEDDPDNDPMIKSMRSVWLGMREEDPPERGFAELMAAARTQAAAMKPEVKEPWWRRSFAFLMRPPVLAAAAVVVVIGGAVVLKGRGGSDDAAMPTYETGLKEQRATELAPSRDLAVSKSDYAVAAPDDERDSKDEPVTPIGGASAGSGSAAPIIKPAGAKRPPPAPVQGEDRGWGGAKENGNTVVAPPPPPPPPPNQDPADSGLLIAGEGKDTNDVKTVKKPVVIDKVPSGQQRPEPKPEAPKADVSEPTIESTGANGRVPVSTEQLVKQAEVAANRKDCPAVRATVARIKKTAPDTYKTRVATQPAIARCLK